MKTKKTKRFKKAIRSYYVATKSYIKRHAFVRWVLYIIGTLLAALALFLLVIYLFFIFYNTKHKNESRTYGVTFISSYARYFDLDPKETMLALRDDLGFKRFRLVSYWKEIESQEGSYDFSDLDWQLENVRAVDGEVTLSIGLRQPRWPECHMPSWLEGQPKDVWYPKLQKYMTAVIERYKDDPVIVSYQLENEHLLEAFGECKDFIRQRLQEEFDLVKSIDPDTPIILSLANNYFGVPTGKPRADEFGVSVYKRVFDSTVTKRYFEYPFPAWYYGGRAGMTEALTGRSSMLHELQAEPWTPTQMKTSSIEEQSKSMDATRLRERIKYARGTGFNTIDLWGGEWWYWRKVKFNDPSLWNVVQQDIKNVEN